MRWLALFLGFTLWPQSTERLFQYESTTGNRLALLMGNASYDGSPLRNPANDALDLAAALAGLGFKVRQENNVNLARMDRVVSEFASTIPKGAAVLVYFAGHGIQIEGENYLVPIGFQAADESDAKFAAFSASRLQEKLEKSPAALKIIILDSCRNNPFRFTRSSANGLAIMDAGVGTFVAFATAPGRTASDNPRERNGLFTKHLLSALRQPGLTLDEVFNQVRVAVAAASDSKQVPWTASSVMGTFRFSLPVSGVSGPVMVPSAAPLNTAEAHADQGASSALRGNHPAAITHFTASIAADPTNPRVYLQRSEIWMKLDQWHKALEDLDRAISLDPSFPAAWRERAMVKERLGDHTGSESDRRKALELTRQ